MTQDSNQTALSNLLGIDDMPDEQKNAFLQRIGNLILDASVGRLLLSLEDEQVENLKKYFATISESEDIFAYLLRTYPDFQSIVEKEVAALQEQTVEVTG